MINKENGIYVQTLLSKPCKALLERFSAISGYSQSFIIKTIVEVQLPREVEKFVAMQKEVKNEKKTQIS